jgi:hypothetical protein
MNIADYVVIVAGLTLFFVGLIGHIYLRHKKSLEKPKMKKSLKTRPRSSIRYDSIWNQDLSQKHEKNSGGKFCEPITSAGKRVRTEGEFSEMKSDVLEKL